MDKKSPKRPPADSGPPCLERVGPLKAQAPNAPGASRGLAAPEVTFAAAIAASLPHSSTLGTESPLHLYYLVGANQATGLLTIQGSDDTFRLMFKKGVVEHARSTLPEQELGRFLVQRGLVKPEQNAAAEAGKDRFGGDLVSGLVGLGYLNPADSFQALRDHGLKIVMQALLVETGQSTWEPSALPPSSSFPLGSRWGMLCDAVRRQDVLSVRRRLGARIDRAITRTGGRIAIADLKLTPQEARVAALFEGGKSIAELVAAHPGEGDLIHRLALLLAECELLGFGEVRPAPAAPASLTPLSPPREVAPRPAPRPPVAAVAQAAAPPDAAASPRPVAPSPAARAPDLADLKAFLERIQDQDHFAILGVHRNATAAQIKAAYFKLAKVYHPDVSVGSGSAEAKEIRAAIFAKASEAWSVLGDEQARARYVQQMASGGTSDVDVLPILQAERLFQMATIMVRTRQYDDARAKLEDAMKLNPEEPEFQIWKAWVDFLRAGDKKSAQWPVSASAIEAALKKNSRCTPGYLFLGQMAKLTGDNALAAKHFERGLAVEPQNPELAREIRYLKK